mgnify:CR=1 FL=1
MPVSPSTIQVLNLELNNFTQEELLQSLQEGILFTPNIDHFVKLQKNEAFYRAYQQADWKVCDSRIIQLLSSIFFSGKIR